MMPRRSGCDERTARSRRGGRWLGGGRSGRGTRGRGGGPRRAGAGGVGTRHLEVAPVQVTELGVLAELLWPNPYPPVAWLDTRHPGDPPATIAGNTEEHT